MFYCVSKGQRIGPQTNTKTNEKKNLSGNIYTEGGD